MQVVALFILCDPGGLWFGHNKGHEGRTGGRLGEQQGQGSRVGPTTHEREGRERGRGELKGRGRDDREIVTLCFDPPSPLDPP